jgi:hypothetical protein
MEVHMTLNKFLLTLALGATTQLSFADLPTNTLLIARVSAIAYANNPSLDVYNASDIVNGRPRAGAQRYGAAAGSVMKAITGATSTVSKDEANRWANVRNPCSKVANTDTNNSAIYSCSVQVKYHDDEALVTETFSYRALVTNHDGASDYSAAILSDFITRSRAVTEGN